MLVLEVILYVARLPFLCFLPTFFFSGMFCSGAGRVNQVAELFSEVLMCNSSLQLLSLNGMAGSFFSKLFLKF